MSWNKIIGNERIKKILQRAILENRIAHAYLFTGQEGVGKDAFAIQFAKVVNCLHPQKSDESIESCDECKSCKFFDKLTHPNFEYIFAVPSGKSDSSSDNPIDKLTEAQIEEIKSQIELKTEDNFHKITLGGSLSIRVNAIRDAKRKLSLSQSNSGRRFLLVSEAEKMNNESANAFLKTLEEPHENVTIILTTSKPDAILQTIKSRCQLIKFGTLPDELIAQKLNHDMNIEMSKAIFAASLSMGSYTKAVESFDSNLISLRETIIEILRKSLKKKNYRIELYDIITKFIKDTDKSQIVKALQLLILWFRDAEILKSNPAGKLVNQDSIESINKFVSFYLYKDFTRVITEIENSVYLHNRNVNPQALIFALFIKIRQIFIDL